jgi:hypothetical protein
MALPATFLKLHALLHPLNDFTTRRSFHCHADALFIPATLDRL